MDCRCGLVKRPTRRPNARSNSSIMRAVVVLPLVPATWMTGIARGGDPSRWTRALMRGRERAGRVCKGADKGFDAGEGGFEPVLRPAGQQLLLAPGHVTGTAAAHPAQD